MTESTHGGAAPSLPRIVLTVFLPFASGYYLSYFFRTVNAVIAPNLIADVGLSAGDLGLMTAAYFLAFAAFQVPLGLLLDHFGPSKVQTILLLTAAAGAFVFALGDSKTMLFTGRALIGLGVSGGLMASFKAIVMWFPRDRIPLVNGLFMAFGGLGALSATAPVEAALSLTDWRGVYTALGIATIAVAALIFLITPDKPSDEPPEPFGQQIKGLAGVFRSWVFWRLAPIGATSAASGLAIQTLWVGPWLKDVAHLDRTEVAAQLTVLAFFLMLGFIAVGVIADVLYKKWHVAPRTVMLFLVNAFILVQISILFEPVSYSYLVWILFGLSSNASVLVFALLSQHFPSSQTARALTAFNVFVFSVAFLMQYLVGAIIDLYPLTASGGYQPEAFAMAFGAIAAAQVVAMLWYMAVGKFEKPERQSL